MILETAGRRGCSSFSGLDVLAVTPFAVSAGPRAYLQALRTRVLAYLHGVLARQLAYSHKALADKDPCLQARAVLFASRYSYVYRVICDRQEASEAGPCVRALRIGHARRHPSIPSLLCLPVPAARLLFVPIAATIAQRRP